MGENNRDEEQDDIYFSFYKEIEAAMALADSLTEAQEANWLAQYINIFSSKELAMEALTALSSLDEILTEVLTTNSINHAQGMLLSVPAELNVETNQILRLVILRSIQILVKMLDGLEKVSREGSAKET